MKIETIEYLIPTWAVCCIEYGDCSGLEPEDVTAIDEWMDTLPKRYLGISYSEDSSFYHSNDIHSLGDNCVTATLSYEVK